MRLLMTAALLLAALPAAAFDLVTPAEARDEAAAPPPPTMRSLPSPSAPTIELLSPAIGKPVGSPIDIRLRWAAREGAAIDSASVKVRYGRFGLDVTSRVLGAAHVDGAGIDAPGAKLPPGEHRLTVEVSDTQQRVGKREFVVVVAE